MSSSSIFGDVLKDTVNDLLRGIDHSAAVTNKYRDFERYLVEFLGIEPGAIYTAYISKAGNIAVRFSQSDRARSARCLIAVIDPPQGESIQRSLDTLVRYSVESRPGVEILALVPSREGWQAALFLYPATNASPTLQPVAESYDGVTTFAMAPKDAGKGKGPRAPKLQFVVAEAAQDIRGHFPLVVLHRDRWDDYHYRTTFNAVLYLADGERVPIGDVKILHRGQRDGETPMPEDGFGSLGAEYCSLGQSYSYYEVVAGLPQDLQRSLMRGLRDVVYDRRIRRAFENEPGFEKSLLRTGQATRAIADAPALFASRSQSTRNSGMDFTFRTDVGGSSFKIDFSFNQSPDLPDRINAIIGYNGTGKTQLLSKIALVATGDLAQRDSELSEYGAIEDSASVRFGSVIAISYSAFDTFVLPDAFWQGQDAALARRRLRDKGDVFGYVYCGLRKRSEDDDQNTKVPRGLKSINELTEDFSRSLGLARQEERRQLLFDALSVLGAEPSFGRTGLDSFRDKSEKRWRDAFESLSTGHKIVLNIVAQIVGHCAPGSLVLLDEPESHLHPSLLAALLRAINIVLRGLDSYAIVATHSPVVLQEIPRSYVRILQRYGHKTSVVEPLTETFGENVGYLTTNVFNLDSTQTDYHEVLERLAAAKSIEAIEELFDNEMSMQARAYVRSLQARGRR